MKHFILGLRIAFYISALLFFNNNVILFSAIILINILFLESIYYSFLPVILILFIPLPYKILLVAGYIIYIASYRLLKRNRYFSLLAYGLFSIGACITLYVMGLFYLSIFIIVLIGALIILIITHLFMFTRINKKYYTVPINEELIQMILLFSYLMLGLYYNLDYSFFALLFMQLFISYRYYYNITFGLCYFLYTLIFRQIIDINTITYLGISYLPFVSIIGFGFTSIYSYLVLFDSLLIIATRLVSKKYDSKYILTNNIAYFKSYLEDIKNEYNRLLTIKNIRASQIKKICTGYCNSCTRTSLCKNKADLRASFLIGAISGSGDNIYNCPYYDSFYLDTCNIVGENKVDSLGIEILVEEFEEIVLDDSISNRIYSRLLQEIRFYGYKPKGFIIYNKYKTTFFSLSFNDVALSEELLLRLASRLLKEELDIKSVIKDKEITFYIFKRPKLKINYSEKLFAKESNYVSGDNYLIKRDYNDSYMFILSDGMGNGHRAYLESMQVIKLTDKLLNYPFSVEASLKMLKGIYNIKREYDSYATLDLLIINTAKRMINLYKMGSTTTYLFHENKLTKLENKALPMELDIANSSYELEIFVDDIIILASDGISDYIEDTDLINILKCNTIPEVINDKIIKCIKNKEGNLKDDASLIVIQVY